MVLKNLTTKNKIHMLGTHFCVIQPDDLANLTSSGFGAMNPFNLYMIARRPRIMLDPMSVKVADELISGHFTVKNGESVENHNFSLLNQLGTSQIRFESPAPSNMFYVYDENEHLLAMGKTANLIPLCRESLDELLNLEVLYISQPSGLEEVNNPSKILDLPTVQDICSDILQRSIDHEVWIILWSFLEMKESTNLNLELLNNDEEAELLKSVIERKISDQQCMSFAEAALIRYFEPEYNNRLSRDLRNDAEDNPKDSASLDVSSITVEINTEEISCSLWSPKVEPFYMHLASFNFNSADERNKLFEFNYNEE